MTIFIITVEEGRSIDEFGDDCLIGYEIQDEEKECTYLARIEDDMTITGPGKRVELLNREPVVISINGMRKRKID